MRILMLSDVYFPRINGVSTSIQTFSRSLIAQGHSVTLIAPDYPEPYEAEFEVIRIRSSKLPFDPEDRLMSLRLIKALAEQLKQQDFDIIHIQTPFVAHYAGVFLGKQLGIKTVTSYHTFFEAYFEKYLPRLPKSWLRSVARMYSRKQCNQVDGVISPSNQMLSKLHDYGVTNRSAIIPTGLPASCFTKIETPRFRERYSISKDTQVLLYVGRVAFEKNIDFLISMFQQVHKKTEKAVLLIAGEGPALESLKKQAKRLALQDSVIFVGYLDRSSELLECYQSSNVFVFASETETQGLVLLEAMASGLPVISCASMGSLDVLQEGQGCHISPLNQDAFADRVLSLIQNPEHARALSQSGIDYASQWSDQAKGKDMLGFYQAILGPSSEELNNEVTACH